MKLASAIYDSFYPFDRPEDGLFDGFDVVIKPDNLTKEHALIVWGGSDISPSLYNREVSIHTGASENPSKRDQIEWALMQRAKELNIPIIGICRGAQMLCALAGGFLVQDVTDHTDEHHVDTHDGDIFRVSSLHHQMMYPFDVEHELIAWSDTNRSQHYMDVDTPISVHVEPELVYFPKERGIAIQWHPEFMERNCTANRYVYNLLDRYLTC